MRRISRFLLNTARWMGQPRHAWAAVLVTGAAIGLSLRAASLPSDGLRYAGLSLQLLGVGTVLAGLEARRRLFGLPSLISAIQSWWSNRPRIDPPEVTLSAEVSLQLNFSVEGEISIMSPDDPSRPPEVRIAALASSVESVQRQVHAVRAELIARASRITNEVQVNANAQTAQHQELSSTVRQLGVGSVPFEVMGLAWLLAGVVFATIPSELVPLFSWAL